MIILDTFEYNGKTALYCKTNIETDKASFTKAEINGTYYDILKTDIMHSLSGNIAITLLLDTSEKIPVQQNVTLS